MAKRAHEVPVPAIVIDPGAAEPLHRQLYFGIRAAILDGRLRPGLRLPSTRALASELGLSRNTVLAAFEQLAAEGYLDGRVGAGTYVSRRLPEDSLLARGPGAPPPARPARPPGPSRRGAMLAALGRSVSRPRPFAPGVPELDQFPFEAWARLLARRWRQPRREFLVGSDPGGYRPLREAVADYLSSARAVACSPDQVIITSGTQQALDLVTRLLIDPGDPVWVEEPGYAVTAAALIAAGARIVPVAIDAQGLSVEAGRAAEPRARLACISPSHQFPLGITMSLQRRLELLDWAREVDGFVLEDDYDSEYRYAGRPLAALQGLDRSGRVIYLGTLSKVMFPGLRIGYMVVPEHLTDSFLAVRSLIDAHPSSIAQGALADFIGEGHLAGHIRRMRLLYGARQTALIEAVRGRLDGALALEAAAAGMHLVGRLEPGLDDQAITREARARSVEAPALSTYYRCEPGQAGVVLGYAGVPERALAPAVDLLARAIEAGRAPAHARRASRHVPAQLRP